MNRQFLLTAAILLTSICASSAANAAPTITNLGYIPGGDNTFPLALSADGTTVVGQVTNSSGVARAFRWTAGTGVQDIGAGVATAQSAAAGVNGDGSVIVGSYGVSPDQAFRWTASTGSQDLGSLPGGSSSSANSVSANGSIVVGSATDATTFHSFRWTTATGIQALPNAAGFDYSLGASGISADGSVIVGTNGNKGGAANIDHAYRYTDADGYQDLGVQPGFTRSVARAVSGDGQTVIGFSQLFPPPSGSGAVIGAFRWTAATGLVPLFLDDETYSVADAVTFDGSRIVGTSTASAGPRAVMWTSRIGSVDLNTYLPTLGVNLTGWNLNEATGISSDGSVISGYGTFNGVEAGWIVSTNAVPEPSTGFLSVIAAVVIGGGRRRRASVVHFHRNPRRPTT
jgi:probable HAF family extracellular repeat protein